MDDFDREVYCIAGLPFDAVDLSKAMAHLYNAKQQRKACFLTTPNLNFLALAQNDAQFRDSVIHSDLVIVDGMPIVWIAKLLGIPINERVAGSTLFEELGKQVGEKIKVYFFGGPEGAAAEASKRINAGSTGLVCVGFCSPGFGSIQEMSTAKIIDDINASEADFLVVALGAKKGQAWIVRNFDKLQCPLVSHLGAVVNFEAKRLKRAPEIIQKFGLEWLWRIKEEPQLWKRYWFDGLFFLRFLITKILPQVLWRFLNRKKLSQSVNYGEVVLDETSSECKLIFSGVFLDPISTSMRNIIRQASQTNKNVYVDLAATEYLSFGTLGLLLLLKKYLNSHDLKMTVTNLNASMLTLFDRNGLNYLVSH